MGDMFEHSNGHKLVAPYEYGPALDGAASYIRRLVENNDMDFAADAIEKMIRANGGDVKPLTLRVTRIGHRFEVTGAPEEWRPVFEAALVEFVP